MQHRLSQTQMVTILLLVLFVSGLVANPTRGQRPEDDQLFQLINQIRRLQNDKQEKRATPLVESALALAAKTMRGTDPRNVSVLIMAGEIYWRAGESQKAQRLLQQAAQIAESTLEPSHPLVFTSLTDLALFYREQENGAASQPLFEKIVALMEKRHGPEHYDVAIYVKLLAESHYQQGDYVGRDHCMSVPWCWLKN